MPYGFDFWKHYQKNHYSRLANLQRVWSVCGESNSLGLVNRYEDILELYEMTRSLCNYSNNLFLSEIQITALLDANITQMRKAMGDFQNDIDIKKNQLTV